MNTIKSFVYLAFLFFIWSCTSRDSFQLGRDNLVFEITKSVQVDLLKNEVHMMIPSNAVIKLDSVFSTEEQLSISKKFNTSKIGELRGTHHYIGDKYYQVPSSNLTITFISSGSVQSKLIVNEFFDGDTTEEKSRVYSFVTLIDSLFRNNEKINKMISKEEVHYKQVNEGILWDLLKQLNQ